jgi:hypothetical protein
MGSLFIDCYRGLEAAIINRQTEFVERFMQMLLPIVLVVVGCVCCCCCRGSCIDTEQA